MEWEGTIKNSEKPSLKDLIIFLEQKCKLLEAVEDRSVSKNKPQQVKGRSNNISVNYAATVKDCSLCPGSSHPIFSCSKFKAMKMPERESHVRKVGLCFNCLSSYDHRSRNCGAGSCKLCGKRHNSLLHYPQKPGETQQQHPVNIESKQPISSVESKHQKQSSVVSTSSHTSYQGANSSVLLSTAVVQVCLLYTSRCV